MKTEITPELYRAIQGIVDDRLQLIAASREEFEEVKGILKELAEAQRKTEERLDKLTARVDSLAETVQGLIEAQRRTEERLDKLAEAQRKTEETVQYLIKSHERLRKEVGGITHTIGYYLENEAMKVLPEFLKRDFGIVLEDRLRRDFVRFNGYEMEVNIFGYGKIDGERVMIIGESKSQLGKKDVKSFVKKLNKFIRPYVRERVVPVLITHLARKDVQRLAEEEGIKIYYSYEF